MNENMRLTSVSCRCGGEHLCWRPLTADEKRERNRMMIAHNVRASGYPESVPGSDAWQFRTLNLDALVSAGVL